MLQLIRDWKVIGRECFWKGFATNLEHFAQVLAAVPEDVAMAETMFLLRVPSEGFLGKNEKDLSYVTSQRFDKAGTLLDDPTVSYVFTGRLGSLRGGFLHLKDKRDILGKAEIKEIALSQITAGLEKKRSGLVNMETYSILHCTIR